MPWMFSVASVEHPIRPLTPVPGQYIGRAMALINFLSVIVQGDTLIYSAFLSSHTYTYLR